MGVGCRVRWGTCGGRKEGRVMGKEGDGYLVSIVPSILNKVWFQADSMVSEVMMATGKSY